MNVPLDAVLVQLCGADERAFERGIHSLNRRWIGADGIGRLAELATLLQGFSEVRGLGSTEVSRRVRITVELAKLPERQQRELASSLTHLPATVRQVVTTSLPPQLRRLVYSPQSESEVISSRSPTASVSIEPSKPDEAPTLVSQPELRDWASVILLGTFADHEENRVTLERGDLLRSEPQALNSSTNTLTTRSVASSLPEVGGPEFLRPSGKAYLSHSRSFELHLAQDRRAQPTMHCGAVR